MFKTETQLFKLLGQSELQTTQSQTEFRRFYYIFFVIAFNFENTANKGEGHKVTPGLALSHPFHNRQDVHHISINNIVPRESKSLHNHSDT